MAAPILLELLEQFISFPETQTAHPQSLHDMTAEQKINVRNNTPLALTLFMLRTRYIVENHSRNLYTL
jgi:hypothetical protein